MATTSVYRRIPHAGHYIAHTGAKGHDLEQWDVVSPERIRTSDIPLDAEYYCGWRDHDGAQHWIFQRVAPLSPMAKCPLCATCKAVR